MISEARGRATPHGPANQGRAPHTEGPIKSGMNRSPSRAASAGRIERSEEMEREEMEREEMEREEREEMEASSSWNPPLEIAKLPDTKGPKTVRKAHCQSSVFKSQRNYFFQKSAFFGFGFVGL